MRPKRQILPASGPRPAPISRLNSLSSVPAHLRFVDAFRHVTALICGSAVHPAHEELESHRLETRLEREVSGAWWRAHESLQRLPRASAAAPRAARTGELIGAVW